MSCICVLKAISLYFLIIINISLNLNWLWNNSLSLSLNKFLMILKKNQRSFHLKHNTIKVSLALVKTQRVKHALCPNNKLKIKNKKLSSTETSLGNNLLNKKIKPWRKVLNRHLIMIGWLTKLLKRLRLLIKA